MKRIKRGVWLSMLLMSLLSVTTSISVSELRTRNLLLSEDVKRAPAQACDELLKECARVVNLQKQALHAAQKEREVREAIIEGQEKQLKEIKAERNVAVKTSVISIGGLLLLLLL